MRIRTLITVIMIMMFAAVVISSEATAQDYVSQLEASGVSFIAVGDNKVTIIKTTDTADAVDALVESAPEGVEVTIVEYQDKGKLGYEIDGVLVERDSE